MAPRGDTTCPPVPPLPPTGASRSWSGVARLSAGPDDRIATDDAPAELRTGDGLREDHHRRPAPSELGEAADRHPSASPRLELWVRVSADESWADTGRVLQLKGSGLRRTSDFLSVDRLAALALRQGRWTSPSRIGWPQASPTRTLRSSRQWLRRWRLPFPGARPGHRHSTPRRVITIKADVPRQSMSMPTWIASYAGANWHERETHEMFGDRLRRAPRPAQHLPALASSRAIPLRKDFPLALAR